jgi:competence protein ComEA
MTRFALLLAALVSVHAFHALPPAYGQTAKPPVTAAADPININSATSDQIAGLPGIGVKTAELVVQYRVKNGPFKKIEEIMNVRGIGEKSFLRIKDRLTVATPKTDK